MNIDDVLELCIACRSTEVMDAVAADPSLLHLRSFGGIGDSLLDLAVATGNPELTRSLILAGADPNAAHPCGDIPLITAIRSRKPKRTETVSALIECGANVNAPGMLLGSALHAAVAEASVELIELLLDKGADINIRGRDGETPLWFACVGMKREVLERILKDANISVPTLNGGSEPLFPPCLGGDESVVRVLLMHGADTSLRDTTTGRTPLDLAIASGNAANVSALRQAGAVQ